MAEPAGVSSVPGPHVYLPAGGHDPDRHPPPQAAVGASDSDLQLRGRIDETQAVRRPRGSHGRGPPRQSPSATSLLSLSQRKGTILSASPAAPWSLSRSM